MGMNDGLLSPFSFGYDDHAHNFRVSDYLQDKISAPKSCPPCEAWTAEKNLGDLISVRKFH